LPTIIEDNIKRKTNDELRDLFNIESESLEIGEDFELEFKFDPKIKAIQVQLRAFRTLRNHFLTIKPRHFNLLPIADLVD
jgi:hypothetical protein